MSKRARYFWSKLVVLSDKSGTVLPVLKEMYILREICFIKEVQRSIYILSFQESYERARVILKAHQTEHRTLAQALMKYETLDVQDVKDLLEGREPEYKKNIV